MSTPPEPFLREGDVGGQTLHLDGRRPLTPAERRRMALQGAGAGSVFGLGFGMLIATGVDPLVSAWPPWVLGGAVLAVCMGLSAHGAHLSAHNAHTAATTVVRVDADTLTVDDEPYPLGSFTDVTVGYQTLRGHCVQLHTPDGGLVALSVDRHEASDVEGLARWLRARVALAAPDEASAARIQREHATLAHRAEVAKQTEP